MKLLAVTFLTTIPTDQLAGLRLSRRVDLVTPVDSHNGMRVLLRGSAVILLQPDGTAHEFPRAQCVLTWQGKVDDFDKLATHTSEPLERKRPTDAASDAELEKLTAPAAKATR